MTILQAEKSGSSSAVRLSDGALVVATNVVLQGDSCIQISKSRDAGEHWRPVVMLPLHDTAVLFENEGCVYAFAMNLRQDI